MRNITSTFACNFVGASSVPRSTELFWLRTYRRRSLDTMTNSFVKVSSSSEKSAVGATDYPSAVAISARRSDQPARWSPRPAAVGGAECASVYSTESII